MLITYIYNAAMKYSSALPEEYSQKLFKNWQEVIDRNELCTILTPPVFANDYRIHNFLEWQTLNSVSECEYIHLHVNLISDPEEVKRIFEKSNKPLIISPGEQLLEEGYYSILSAIIFYKIKYNRAVLIFFESTVLKIKNSPSEVSHNLLQNVSYIPLFSYENTKHFCMHIANRWNINLSENQIIEIFEYTGGHVWLVKESLRQLSKKEQLLSKIFSSQEMVYKKNKIWELLSCDHKKYLVNYIDNFGYKGDSLILNDLINLNLIRKEMPYYPEFITELALGIQHKIVVKHSEIFFNDVNVTTFFSKKEQKLFIAFYSAVDYKLTRQKVASAIWDDKNEYSEWALDKVISRLRLKFKKLGISGKTLITLRDHGYQLMIK